MMKILLTVPREENRSEVLAGLRHDGYQVVTAASGTDAIRMLEAHQPDVAVVDRWLPAVDGLAVAGWARDHVKLHRVPVILLASPEELAPELGLLESGVADVLLKPIRYAELKLRLTLRANNEGRFAGLFTGREVSRMAIQESLSAFLHQHRDREEEILGLLFTDPETGLNNRAYFKIKLSEELKRAQRYSLPLSALLIKLVMRRSEAPAAPPPSALTLKEIAGILLLESRDLDIISRFAGSDFALLLPNTLQDGAVLLAQRISERIIVHPFSDTAGGRDFQVRVGIATYPMDGIGAPLDLMNRAHQALFKAQDFGTREICIWEANGAA